MESRLVVPITLSDSDVHIFWPHALEYHVRASVVEYL